MEIPDVDTSHGIVGFLVSIVVIMALAIWQRVNGDVKAAKAVAASADTAAAVAKALAESVARNSITREEFLQYLNDTAKSRDRIADSFEELFKLMREHTDKDSQMFTTISGTLARLDERSMQGRASDKKG